MKNMKKELQAVKKDLNVLYMNIERLLKAIDKPEKPKAKAVKAKTVKKTVPKKTSQPTDTDKIVNIIKRFKKGVDTGTLKKRTGFNDKKISNIVHRAFKAGKIKRVDKGIYIKGWDQSENKNI